VGNNRLCRLQGRSLAIVVWITDAANHDAPFPFVGAASSFQAKAALNSILARVIGVRSGQDTAAYTDLHDTAAATDAVVTPSA